MRKHLLLLTMLSMVIFSCKKENNSKKDDGTTGVKTYEVSFNVNAITASASPYATQSVKKTLATTALTTKYLTALFYDANSVLLKRVDQTTGDAGYGTFKVQLPLGTVHSFFIATNDNSFTISLRKGNTANLTAYPKGYPALTYSATDPNPKDGEFYTLSKDLNVTAPFSQSVVLNRSVSVLTFKLDDILPASAVTSKIEVDLPVFSNYLDLVNGVGDLPTGYGVGSLEPQTSDVGRTGYSETYFIYPVNCPTITLTSGTNKKTATIPGGKLMPNTQYTLEGYLFNDRPGDFTVGINPDWNPSVNVPFAKKAITSR